MTASSNVSPDSWYELALRHSSTGILIAQIGQTEASTVTDFLCRYANVRFAEWLGVAPSALLHKPLKALFTDKDDLFQRCIQAVEKGQVIQFSVEHPLADTTSLHWYDVEIAPFDDGIICTVTDISRYRPSSGQVADQVSQQAELLKGVLNGTSSGIAVYEALRDGSGQVVDFVIKLFNEAARQQVPLQYDDVVGMTLLQISPHSKEIGIFHAAVEVVETGVPQVITRDYPYLDKSFQTSINRFGANGITVSAVDVTLTRHYQRQAERYAENLQAVLNASPAAIGFLKTQRNDEDQTEDFCLAVCNQKFADIVNKSINALIGQSVSLLAPLLWGSDTTIRLMQIRDSGQSVYEERQDLNGTGQWMALAATKQDDGVVLTGLDITNLKHLQQQREETVEQLRQSAGMVEQITTLQQQLRQQNEQLRTSSHDLRGSLGVIEGAAGLLMYADTNEERSQILDMIQRNVQQTTRLISELVDYSKQEVTYLPPEFGPFDAARLLHQLARAVRPLAEAKELTLRFSGSEPLPVEGDALLVLHIAQSIIHNAIKHTKEGSVTLCWNSLGPHEWEFWIEDTGPGLDPALAQQLTHSPESGRQPPDPNIQTALNRLTPGEGLNLHIVQQLCTLLKGRFLVKSLPGKGSLLRVVLPRHYSSSKFNY